MFSLDETPLDTHILKDAYETVISRGEDYGNVLEDFTCAASILRAIVLRRYGIDIPFTPDFIPLMMALVIKGSREAHKPKYDTRKDICGYMDCENMTLKKMKEAKYRAQYSQTPDKCNEPR